MCYKLEIDGGKLNGAIRYYKTLKTARTEAKKLKWTAEYEHVYIDIYEVNTLGKKRYLETIEHN